MTFAITSSPADHALHQQAVLGETEPRGHIAVAGKDRASYLQGLLTNDIQALKPGSGCYSAWLNPQGRMLTDLHVLESGDMILLDVPAVLVESTLQRLDQFLFSEDVQLADLSASIRSIWVHGPRAADLLQPLVTGAIALASWSDYQNGRGSFEDAPVSIARIDQLGVPGYRVLVAPEHERGLRAALLAAGVVEAPAEVIEGARLEAGYPLFGLDMDTETIPLEAGIEGRAISLTKGCYVGQEVIIRVLHRGHGRVAKRLVTLRIDGAPPVNGAKVVAGEREIGRITSAARSSRFGTLAFAYVHRDFVEPGTAVSVEGASGTLSAVVAVRPT